MNLEPIQIKRKTPFNKKYCKIYHDGSHFIAHQVVSRKKQNKKSLFELEYKKYNSVFDKLYAIALKNGITQKQMFNYLKITFLEQTGIINELDELVDYQLKRLRQNYYSRLKRFKRKANLNAWTHFVTITYDSKKMDAITFRTKLKKTLSNLHTRRGWCYMGVFENAPKTGRVHFHALMYIPDGEIPGKFIERRDYSTKKHEMQSTLSNTFFEKTFGRNDFQTLSQADLKLGNTLNYLIKYLSKTNERIVYSRNIPDVIYEFLSENQIACSLFDYVLKYVLFDDVISLQKNNFKRANNYYGEQAVFL